MRTQVNKEKIMRLMGLVAFPIEGFYVPDEDIYVVKDGEKFYVVSVYQGVFNGAFEHDTLADAFRSVAHTMTGRINQTAAANE